eukprot:448272_1
MTVSITGFIISSLCLIVILFIAFKFSIVYFKKFRQKSAVSQDTGNASRTGDNEFGNDTHSSVGSRAGDVENSNTISVDNVKKSNGGNVAKVKNIVHCFHFIMFILGICCVSTTILVSTANYFILSTAIISFYHTFVLTHLTYLWYQNNLIFADSKLAVSKKQNLLFALFYIITLSSCIVAVISPSLINKNTSLSIRITLVCSYCMTFMYSTAIFIFKISRFSWLPEKNHELYNFVQKYAFINFLMLISTTSTFSVYVSYSSVTQNSVSSKIILFTIISISCMVNILCLFLMQRHAQRYYNKYCIVYSIICNCEWFMPIVATKKAWSNSSNNKEDVELQSMTSDTLDQLKTIDSHSCKEHLFSEQILFDSFMKIYSENLETYIDVAGILTMTHLYLTSPINYQIWHELAYRTKINEIEDNTCQIDDKLATEMARNLALFDDEKINDSISLYFVNKTAKEIKLQILLNKQQSLLEIFNLDKTYRKKVKKIKFIKINNFFNGNIPEEKASDFMDYV